MKVETLASQPGKIGVVAVQNQLGRRRITFVGRSASLPGNRLRRRRIGFADAASASPPDVRRGYAPP